MQNDDHIAQVNINELLLTYPDNFSHGKTPARKLILVPTVIKLRRKKKTKKYFLIMSPSMAYCINSMRFWGSDDVVAYRNNLWRGHSILRKAVI